jgi:hypothetical protein
MEGTMPVSLSTQSSTSARLARPTLIVAAVLGVTAAATAVLWTYYGTTVFFEMVRTGWIACF